MISYSVYKLVHILSIFGLLMMTTAAFYSPERRKLYAIAIGILGFLVLLGGFGALARLGVGMTSWVIAKVVIWLIIVGGASVAIKRLPHLRSKILPGVWILSTLAAIFAIYKP